MNGKRAEMVMFVRQNHIKIVVGDFILFAVCGSCSEKPNN